MLSLAGIGVGLATVVPPRQTRAIITVSRLGERVRLLPPRFSLSFLGVARRRLVPRIAGNACIDIELEATLPGGARAILPVRLLISGAGVLPITTSRVRALGWQAAWRERLAGRVSLDARELTAIAASSRFWAEIFTTDGSGPPLPDLRSRVAPAVAPLELAGVEIGSDLDAALVRAEAGSEFTRRSHAPGRLVILGLDALDWALVDELVARGAMPSLGRLIRDGAHAVLEVPPPLISPLVWTTIGTGRPPEEHGVLDFLESDPGGGAPHPVSAASRRVPAIWEMVSAAGRSTAVVGWWATFPAQAPIRGAVYSDRLTEQLLGLSAAVPGLADPPPAEAVARQLAVKAADVTPAMLAPFATVAEAELAAAVGRRDAWDDPIGGLAKLVAASVTVERLTLREVDRGTDVVFAYLEGTDTVGHLFGAYRPPALPGSDPALARRFGGVVDRYYAWVDRWIGDVARRLAPEDTLVIVSDHGFRWSDGRPRVPAGAHAATAVQWHRPEGVFLVAGHLIRASATRHRLGILDVGPCLMALAGLPADVDMPGHVPDWLLRRVPGPARPLRYAALLSPPAIVPVALPPEARQEELEKLRSLGYLAGGGSGSNAEQAEGRDRPGPAVSATRTPAPDRAEARRLNNLATIQASAGENTVAERTFRQAIAADPTYAAPYYNLSTLLRTQGWLKEADGPFWVSIRLGIQERELAVVRLALDYRARALPDMAREAFARGRELFPDSGVIWLNSGVFLGEQGDLTTARECLERAVRLAPGNPNGYRNLAKVLLELGDRDGARAALAEAVALEPSHGATRDEPPAIPQTPTPPTHP